MNNIVIKVRKCIEVHIGEDGVQKDDQMHSDGSEHGNEDYFNTGLIMLKTDDTLYIIKILHLKLLY